MPGLLLSIVLILAAADARGQAPSRVLDPGTHHLRVTEDREWASFARTPDADALEIPFSAESEADTLTLSLRQEDVKQGWQVDLNGRSLGALVRNEQPLKTYLAVPRSALRTTEDEGANRLAVRQDGTEADDVLVGPIALHERSPSRLLSEARLAITVREEASGEPVPARITVVDSAGALQPLRVTSSGEAAVRTGVIYTAPGTVSIGVPAGTYTIYAGRGPEYSVDSTTVELGEGSVGEHPLTVERVVDTDGWIASDTHVHTVTHSGHGDATTEERVMTLAGEGIELPVATDHNVHADYEPVARKMGVRRYFTPVIGNEVTTPVGHVNVFPVETGARIPPYEVDAWPALFEGLRSTPGVEVAILNHGRDVHDGFRPFGPEHFNPVTGRNRDGWPTGYDAMEVINSSAQQVELMQLIRDWFAHLDRGLDVTPVGSSDGHDVNRYIVGQGRTYIRGDDSDPSALAVDRLSDRLRSGRVTVSEGLFAEIEVEDGAGPGTITSADGTVSVRAKIQGPGWVRARSAALFLNGRKIREVELPPEAGARSGVKWAHTWTLSPMAHDGYLVLVTRGPGVRAPFWPIPKPYQHTSIRYEPEVVAVTGAVRVDADGDGSYFAPRDYAERVVRRTNGSPERLIELLTSHDRAVAAQAAELFRLRHPEAWAPTRLEERVADASSEVRKGVEAYLATLE